MKKYFVLGIALLFFTQPAFCKSVNWQKQLSKAVVKGDITKAEECIKNGADVNAKGCLLCDAILSNKQEMLEFLLKNGANPDCPDYYAPPMFFALTNNDNTALDKLLEYKADPNRKCTVPLITEAITEENAYAVEKLLEAGADTSKTFMKIPPLKLAFWSENQAVIDAVIKAQDKDFDKQQTEINNAVNLLNTIDIGVTRYKVVNGDNPFSKPIIIRFCNLGNFGKDFSSSDTAISYIFDKQMHIFIDNSLRNEPPEVIATMIAGETIHTDNKNSQTEFLVKILIDANIFEAFAKKNPKLLEDKTSTLIPNYFITLHRFLEQTNDYNLLWNLVKKGHFKGYPKTSPGFKNKDLNSYFQ